jgi:energy-coupling factor transport system substrate-specific component
MSSVTPDTPSSTHSTAISSASSHRLRWRVVDIAVASVIGVASGLVFWIVGILPLYDALEAVVPGLSGLMGGLWVFAAPLALFIVRKPGAGLYAEVLACFVEIVLGSQWDAMSNLIPALLQGVFAEIVFAVTAYRLWNWALAMVSGALAAIGQWVYELFHKFSAISINGPYGVIYIVTTLVSGALVAGLAMWGLYIAIAKTGALDRFESGRIVRYGAKK